MAIKLGLTDKQRAEILRKKANKLERERKAEQKAKLKRDKQKARKKAEEARLKQKAREELAKKRKSEAKKAKRGKSQLTLHHNQSNIVVYGSNKIVKALKEAKHRKEILKDEIQKQKYLVDQKVRKGLKPTKKEMEKLNSLRKRSMKETYKINHHIEALSIDGKVTQTYLTKDGKKTAQVKIQAGKANEVISGQYSATVAIRVLVPYKHQNKYEMDAGQITKLVIEPHPDKLTVSETCDLLTGLKIGNGDYEIISITKRLIKRLD